MSIPKKGNLNNDTSESVISGNVHYEKKTLLKRQLRTDWKLHMWE